MKVNTILDVDLPNNSKIYILGDINKISISNKLLVEFMCLPRFNITQWCARKQVKSHVFKEKNVKRSKTFN